MNQSLDLFKQRLLDARFSDEQVAQILNVAEESLYLKKYGLIWEEKPEAIQEGLRSQVPYLKDLLEREVQAGLTDAPPHLLIEGDNYEALKLLQVTHKGKIAIICIDPPYNTGKEFIYNDKLVDKEDSFRHSKWLSFMAKRLNLAKELLTDDGVIFIHIDDNELAPLKLLCDDIFGEENFVDMFIWLKKGAPSGVPPKKMCVNVHEYLLCFSKNKSFAFKGLLRNLDSFKNPDQDPRGPWRSANIRSSTKKEGECFTITDPKTGIHYTDRWAFSEPVLQQMITEDRLIFPTSKKGQVRQKEFYYEFNNENTPVTTFLGTFTTQKAAQELKDIFHDKVFDFPKPCGLLKFLFSVLKSENTIILDFFAGSGTTGQALLELNQEDGGNRQFILCTNNENQICEKVTYERLKRVISGYQTPKGKTIEGIPANLKYLKIELMEKGLHTLEDLSYLYLPHVLPLLQLKHNAFSLVAQSDQAKVYGSSDFRFGIFTELAADDDFELLIQSLSSFEGEKVLYVFSTDTRSYPQYAELKPLADMIQPIPREILNLLKEE